jgi:hypothetical protein
MSKKKESGRPQALGGELRAFFVQKLLVADDRLNLRGWNVQSLKALGRFGRGLFLSPACLG